MSISESVSYSLIMSAHCTNPVLLKNLPDGDVSNNVKGSCGYKLPKFIQTWLVLGVIRQGMLLIFKPIYERLSMIFAYTLLNLFSRVTKHYWARQHR